MPSPMPSKPSRPNQFGITLSDEASKVLRARADRLKTAPATLAAQLLEEALARRSAPRGTDSEVLLSLRRELAALRDAHHDATLKILNTAGGMSVAEVRKWAERRLKR